MTVIGLDCATHTGWCVIKDGKYIGSGVEDFSKRRGESNGSMFLRFRKWLMDFCDNWQPRLIAYEKAHMRGGAATEVCVNITGRVQEVAAERGIEFASVHTGELKKYALGVGRGDKGIMISAAKDWLEGHLGPGTYSRTSAAVMTDDEADAIHIARWAVQNYGV